jgi:hypothetical protein
MGTVEHGFDRIAPSREGGSGALATFAPAARGAVEMISETRMGALDRSTRTDRRSSNDRPRPSSFTTAPGPTESAELGAGPAVLALSGLDSP